MAQISRLRNDSISATQLFRQAFEKEQLAAELIIHDLTAEPTRSVLHRSAAYLAMDCGDIHAAEKLITSALSGNPPQEIVDELKDLFVQINNINHRKMAKNSKFLAPWERDLG